MRKRRQTRKSQAATGTMRLTKRQFGGLVTVQHRYNVLGLMQSLGVVKQSAPMDDILRDADKLFVWIKDGKVPRKPVAATVTPIKQDSEAAIPAFSFPGYEPIKPTL